MRDFESSNFPVDSEGRTYHVECKHGDIANRILTVGDVYRAKRIQTSLDSIRVTRESKRGFYYVTGSFKGVEVTIISIGMGFGVTDMMVREIRASTTGTLAIVRFGSCGSIGKTPAGVVSVCSKGGVIVSKNYDYWAHRYGLEDSTVKPPLNPYLISSVCPADQELSATIIAKLQAKLGNEMVHTGIAASADSFYSSQGRLDVAFGDDNETVIEEIRTKVPGVETLEMESALILHLAKVCTHQSKLVENHPGAIRAAASAMVFFQRASNDSIVVDKIPQLEIDAGTAILDALVSLSLD